MQIALITIDYPPVKSSCAVQMHDLAMELVNLGHKAIVICPDSKISCEYQFEDQGGVTVLRLRTRMTRDIGYFKRSTNEFFMPYLMWMHFTRSPFFHMNFSGIIWYSPSIFFAPFVLRFKKKYACKSYLILRDLFPDWAVDLGILKKGIIYKIFKKIADSQFLAADLVGVQSEKNLEIVKRKYGTVVRKIEVLPNWLAPMKINECSIALSDTVLSNRKILVYAGNMGISQGIDVLISLVLSMTDRNDIGFLFVGRGSEVERIKALINEKRLDNVLILSEMSPDEIPGLFAQCKIGLISLDRRHKTHNIPGKFLSYLQFGLPTLAVVNENNDLLEIINDSKVGIATSDYSTGNIQELTLELLEIIELDTDMPRRCKRLADELFSPHIVATQLIHGLSQG